ncbi:unnamed protein product, partial [Meganyctiphanes norvegica]
MKGSQLLLAVFAAVCFVYVDGSLLGARQCTYGPSYWCTSLKNAKECNAVKHCIQTVWEKKQLPEDNDDICKICKEMVKEARDTLTSNETQEELREVFEGSCKLLPCKIIRDECIHLADDFIPELIDTLASQMNPQMVCATAGLCNSRRVDKMLLTCKSEENEITAELPQSLVPVNDNGEVQHPQPGDCDDCKKFITDTIRLVKTHSKAELMDHLMAVCGQLSSLSDGCMMLVEANFDGIYNFLTQELSPDGFCHLVSMCEDTIPLSRRKSYLDRTGDEPCDFCVAIVRHWKDVLTANTTEIEFKEILEGLCKQSGKYAAECLSLVDQYYLPLYNLIMQELAPKEVCSAVGLCGAKKIFGQHQVPVWSMLAPRDTLPLNIDLPAVDADSNERIPFSRLTPALKVEDPQQPRLIGVNESMSLTISMDEEEVGAPVALPRVKLTKAGINVNPIGQNGFVGAAAKKDDQMCVMCEFAIHFLQNMLEQKDTREDIEQAVENLCDLMPKSIAEQCEDYVEAYGDQVIEMLDQEMDPKVICPLLGLCPAPSNEAPTPGHAVEEPVEDDVSCVMCEYAMEQLDEMIKDDKTEDSIKHALENLCSKLPKSIKGECKFFVDLYTDKIIQLLLDDLTPDQVCTALHLCKTKVPELPHLNPSHQLPVSRLFVPALSPASTVEDSENKFGKQSKVCVLCEFAMVQIDNMLVSNATEEPILTSTIIYIYMPKVMAKDAIIFNLQYMRILMKIVLKSSNFYKLCSNIAFYKISSYDSLRVGVLNNVNLDKCEVCEVVVDYVDQELKTEDVQVSLDTILEEVCKILPKEPKKFCRTMIEVYGPYLANLLAELGNSKAVCQSITMCPKPNHLPLLGAQKCTWGPSYWCQTKMHANACNAVEHCTEKVWMDQEPAI